MRAAGAKAHGADAWLPKQLAGLPLEWFELLARIWRIVLRGGAFPKAWASVRVCLIP